MQAEPVRIKVVGLDPSLRNWGIAQGHMTLGDIASLKIDEVSTICPIISKGKQVRQNSNDLESARQLAAAAMDAAQDAQAIFVEVPVGSQSSRAMASYGVCVGVLGAMRAMGIPIFEVTPAEAKLAGTGKVTASKSEMIYWAMTRHPEVAWPMHTKKGIKHVNVGKAEHQADATATIHAGLQSNAYKQLIQLYKPYVP